MSSWSTDQVEDWAKKVPDVKPHHARVLRDQEVTGRTLLMLTKDELTRHPYNLPGGPASALAGAVEKLKALKRGKKEIEGVIFHIT